MANVKQPVDILILSNGPGELSTWVRPVVQELRRQLGEDREQVRISVVLSPCANASGQEVAIARRYPEIDRVQGAEHFFPFLLWGKTQASWDWRSRGVVLFLGGDQFFPILIGKRLGYRIVIYAEWEARWHRWGDRFGLMNSKILTRVSPKQAHKFTVVGDLMAEAAGKEGMGNGEWGMGNREWGIGNGESGMGEPGRQETGDGRQETGDRRQETGGIESSDLPPPATCHLPPATYLIGLLPGSKPMKLGMGVPLTLAIAEHLHAADNQIQFVIPVAPTLDLPTLARFADPACNPVIQRLGWSGGELVMADGGAQSLPMLKTAAGVPVPLWTEFPAYDRLAECDLCLTTIGANTAELAALTVPMIVLMPTQQLDIMRAWDGLLGILVNLPGLGRYLAQLINGIARYRVGLLAWPNIWAGKEIVPELLGELQPAAIATLVLDYLHHPEKLQQMRSELRKVRGAPGAAQKLVQLVCEELGCKELDCVTTQPLD